MKVAIDRIEGTIAVLIVDGNDDENFHLPVKYLPDGVKEGDHLQVSFSLDTESRDSARNRVEALLSKLKSGARQ